MYDIVFNIVFVMFLIVFLFCLFWPISLPLLIYYIIKKKNNRNYFKDNVVTTKKDYTDIDPRDLVGFDITDVSKLKVYLFDIFDRFERAYNSLDYNTLYNLSTSELYNKYHTNLVVNTKLDEKRIIEKIELKRMIIFSASSDEKQQCVITLIEMSYIDYTQNSKGRILRGQPNKKITEKFEVEFVKSLNGTDSYRCPNCGANTSGTKCDYCKSTIDCDFKINSIKKII